MPNFTNGYMGDKASDVKMNGVAAAGVSQYAAPIDHVHPSDTAKAATNHHHNAAYAAIDHDHDEDYAAQDHDHDGVYQPAASDILFGKKHLIQVADWAAGTTVVVPVEGIAAYGPLIVQGLALADQTAMTSKSFRVNDRAAGSITFEVSDTPAEEIGISIAYTKGGIA